jgi:hypothetical protein
MDNALTQRLILIIGAVAMLTFAGRRKWISATETAWIGTALIFASTGWVLQAVLNITRSDFPDRVQAIWMAVAMTAPLIIALAIGLFMLVRRLKSSPARDTSQKVLKK